MFTNYAVWLHFQALTRRPSTIRSAVMKSRLSTALQVLLWLPRYVNYLPHRKFGVTVLVLGVICITGAAVTASSAPDTPRRGAFAGFFVFLFIGVFPLFLGNVWDIGKHLDERLLPSDRKNPFRENIIELVRLNRQLHGIGGKEANAQRAVLESEIGRLREWPYQQSYETNKA